MTPLTRRPWLDQYAAGVPADVPAPTQTIDAVLDRAAQLYPDRPALDFMGKRTTYAALASQVATAARALARCGVGHGTKVAIALPNCPQHVVAFYAVVRLGGIVVEHNPTYTPQQFAHQLADSGSSHAIVWDKAVPAVLAALDIINPAASGANKQKLDLISVDITTALPTSKRLVLHLPLPKVRQLRHELTDSPSADLRTWDQLMALGKQFKIAGLGFDVPGISPGQNEHHAADGSEERTQIKPTLDDTALLLYTGGTTGTPKGAILTHRNIVVNASQSVAWVPALRPGDEVFYGVLPFFHAFGLTLCLTVPVHCGGLLVIFPKFDVEMVLAAVKRIPGTFFPGVPPMFDRLGRAAQAKGQNLSCFRHAISGAMALDPEVAARWESLTGSMLVEGYGLTETSPIALGNPMSQARRPGMLGIPFPSTEIAILGDTPTHGELLIRGPQVFSGYWNQPEETAAVLDDDGWLHTGDVVELEDDGFVRLVDRIKEVIVTGGFNVYPSEVEQSVASMPEVDEVAVVGLPGSDLGEKVVAAIVLAPGAAVSIEQVRAWCAERISHFALPHELVVLDSLPRSQIGKVLRRGVQASILAALAAGTVSVVRHTRNPQPD